MFGLLEKVTKTAVGVALLPATVVLDAVRLPSIIDYESESSTIKTFNAIADNVTDIATGDWDDKEKSK